MRLNLIAPFLLFLSFLIGTENEQVTIYFNYPQYKDGVVTTDQGGVITSGSLRIQARHITYIQKTKQKHPTYQIIAEGDLMLTHNQRVFVGKRLEYNLATKTGVIYEGVTAIDVWFLGGERIQLNADQTFYVCNAFVTTSANKKNDWKIQSPEVFITQDYLMQAKHVSFRFFDIPIFYIPFFKSNLRPSSDSPARYRIEWDQGMWPKFSMSYRIYSWKYLALFARLDVRPSKGGGIGLESKYRSPTKRTVCLTRSYIDHDTFYRDTNPDKARLHYRLQGIYKTHSADERSHVFVSYDRLSDKNMTTNFKSHRFELNTTKPTLCRIRHRQDQRMLFGINGLMRINSFQGFKQELPSSFLSVHPFEIGKTGILSVNQFKASYLDYVFAKHIDQFIPDFSSMRLAAHQELYRPITYCGITLTPLIGYTGIIYSRSKIERHLNQFAFNYELFLNTTLRKRYQTLSHCIMPYAHYQGIAKPLASTDSPYIFDIEDGYHKTQQLKLGISQFFYLKQYPLFVPNFVCDLYLFSFFASQTFTKTIPKLYALLTWNMPSITFQSHIGWNNQVNRLDYSNLSLAWTMNEHFALKMQWRHRGRFNWRKNTPENFTMELTRSIAQLLDSPLSDARNTFLSRLQIQLAPQWIARLESRIGWGRRFEPSYHETKVDLITTISTSWQLRFTLTHSPAPRGKKDRVSASLSLISK